MTRTERNQYPAALLKDRHSRSGLNKNEAERKHGAGAHNWGSLSQENEYESQARGDADADKLRAAAGEDAAGAGAGQGQGQGEGEGVFQMEEDGVGALPQLGGHAAFEATSPTDSMASLDSAGSAQQQQQQPKDLKGVGRRLSNVSDEERDKARVYREGVRASGGPTSLADIAKTSFGVSSPPNGNAFGTSPTKTKTIA